MKNFDEVVRTSAENIAASVGHTVVSTAHYFLAIIGTLAVGKKEGDSEYAKYFDEYKSILNKYGINRKTFEENFYTIFPTKSSPTNEDIMKHSEILTMIRNINKVSKNEGHSPTIIDMIKEMYSDRSYTFFRILEIMLDEDDIKNLINDITHSEILKNPLSKQIASLEKIPGLTNLNKFIDTNPMTFVGGNKSINQLMLALSCKTVNSAILVGPAGTGKTAIVNEFVKRINEGKAGAFNNRIVYSLDTGVLISGTRFRGDLEERMTTIVKEIVKNPRTILFIDEIHNLISLGAGESGGVGADEILKPYIARGQIQVIGATTNEEYTRVIEPERAMARRFHKVTISEPSEDEVREILSGLNNDYEKYFGRKASESLINKIAELSMKYNVSEANPARSINMLELAFAYSRLFNENNEVVMDDDAYNAIAMKYDIIVSDKPEENTLKVLKDRLFGQDTALERVKENLDYIKAGLIDPERPLCSMLFAGPTGTGKTYTAQLLAENYFGSKRNFIKLDMSEYASEMSQSKLIGADPGFIGYDDEPHLISAVKQNPNSVILFDEIEKAHPTVIKTLLSMLDTGLMIDSHKNTISFKNCVIIFTTNAGYTAKHFEESGLGFVKSKTTSNNINDALKETFPPEFLNRIDDIIIYDGLTTKVAKKLIDVCLDEFRKTSGNKITFNNKDYDEVIKDCNIEEYGARGLKRAVKRRIIHNIKASAKVLA